MNATYWKVDMEAVRFYREPELKSPYLIAAWPGMGGVAVTSAKYLTDSLGAEELGEIDPHGFFDLGGVLVEEYMVEELGYPENKFYFWERGGGDLLIFIGDAQPEKGGYELANLILDVGQRLGVKRVFTFAAAPSHIHHVQRPSVLGVATSPDLVSELRGYDIGLLKEGNISGMNGLLIGVARERNMEGICLLGEIPVYTAPIVNPRSSKAVLEVLSQMLALDIDLSEMDSWARKTDEEIETNIARLRESHGEEMKGLIEYFDRLKEQTSHEVEEDFLADELLKEIEQFLRSREDKGEN